MAERTATQHALRVSLYQTLGSFATLAVALLLNTFAGLELPQSMAAVALFAGAQAYAASIELAAPGTLAPLRGQVALRASGLTFLIQLVLAVAAFVLATAEPDPELADVIVWVKAHLWIIPLTLALTFALLYGFTQLGLGLGIRLGRKAQARKASNAG